MFTLTCSAATRGLWQTTAVLNTKWVTTRVWPSVNTQNDIRVSPLSPLTLSLSLASDYVELGRLTCNQIMDALFLVEPDASQNRNKRLLYNGTSINLTIQNTNKKHNSPELYSNVSYKNSKRFLSKTKRTWHTQADIKIVVVVWARTISRTLTETLFTSPFTKSWVIIYMVSHNRNPASLKCF